MDQDLNQIRTFYINFQKTPNVLRDYFNVEVIFVDYEIEWKVNDFFTYEIINKKITSVKKLNDQNEFEDFDLNILPNNIQDILKDALRSVTNNMSPNDLNTPKICKKYSSMI